MRRIMTRLQLPCPAERIWRVITDLEHWSWRSGLTDLLVERDGRHFVEKFRDGDVLFCRITAFAPCRWYALDMANDRLFGHWEVLLIPTDQGARMELTSGVWIKGPLGNLLAKSWLLRRQRRYVADLRRALEGT